MPELPEVEIVRRNVERWWRGHALRALDMPDTERLRCDPGVSADRLLGQTLIAAERRAKLLLLGFDGGDGLLVHFRMTGKFVLGADARFARLRFHLSNGTCVVYKDQRRLGSLSLGTLSGLRAQIAELGLGPEPWPRPLTAEQLARRFEGERRRVKDALLDPGVIAGVGNIAASEALWRARLRPTLRAAALGPKRLGRLAQAIADHIDFVIAEESGDEIHLVSEAGAQNPFHVYGRDGEPCPCCGDAIRSVRHGGRVTFWCRRCQP